MSTQSRWMFQLCTISSVPIRIHATFLLFLGFVIITTPGGLFNSLWAAAYLSAVFFCVLLHECGHVFTAMLFGIKTRDIVLYPFGGIAMLLSKPKPFAELVITIAGPVVNFIIAGIIYLWLSVSPSLSLSFSFTNLDSFLENLFMTNIFIGFFNLIPAIPMDGGRILRALLELGKIKNATTISARVSQGCSIVMGIVGIFSGSAMLTVISVVVFFGAMQEMITTHTHAVAEGRALKEYTVETEKLYCFTHGTTLSDAIRIAIKSSQEFFPVLFHTQLLGIIDRDALINSAAHSERENEYLSGLMDRTPLVLSADTPIVHALVAAQERGVSVIAVSENDNFEGLVFVERVSELLVIDSIRQDRQLYEDQSDSNDEL